MTGLRFVAAFTVVAYHFAPPAVFSGSEAGAVAITLFFLLSGFILTYTARPRTALRAFYLARVARIYPAYLVGLGLAALLLPLGLYRESAWCPAPSRALPEALLLLQAWLPGRMDCLDGPAWTLSCEAFFYALFPLLLPLVRRVPGRLLGGTVALCWAVGLAVPSLGLPLPLACLPTFTFGMLLGRQYLGGVRVRWPRLSLACAICCLVFVQRGFPLPEAVTEVLLWPACAALLCVLADGTHAAARALALRPLLVLGEASYGLYILHAPLHNILLLFGFFSLWGVHSWTSFAVYSLIAVGASLASLRLVEKPARRAIRATLSPARSARRAGNVPALEVS